MLVTLLLRCALLTALVLVSVATGAPHPSGQRGQPAAKQQDRRPNILFISVDDLRPAGASFGIPEVHVPNLDRLAARGTVLTRAYAQQAVCSPSRTSLMTGLRPASTGIRDLSTHFRTNLPDVITLPQHFKRHAYHVQALGKIYHNQLDDPLSWSVPSWFPVGDAGALGEEYAWADPETIARMQAERDQLLADGHRVGLRVTEVDPSTGTPLQVAYDERFKGPSWEAADVPDDAYPDGKTASKAIETLRQIGDRPFFLAVGFVRPHLPFNAPRRDFDRYPPERIHLPENDQAPADVPTPALHNWGELRTYSDIPATGPLSDQKARELIRAYYAATTYVDRQVGRVLDELERLGLAENTIVVVWSDHGYHLGEQSLWNKHSNFEVATLTPVILAVPGQTPNRTDALVELVDIYPSLVELAGLPIPSGLEGISLVPLLQEPNQTWKTAAFSEYPRGSLLGRSLRTDRYRYTEWAEPDTEPVGRELYDHRADPHETVNLAADNRHGDLVARLSRQLEGGWQAALPPTLDRTDR